MKSIDEIKIADGTFAKIGDTVHVAIFDSFSEADALTTGVVQSIVSQEAENGQEYMPFIEVDVNGEIFTFTEDYIFSTREGLLKCELKLLVRRNKIDMECVDHLESQIFNLKEEVTLRLFQIEEIEKELNPMITVTANE
jgi:hypothetical protein